MTASGQLSRPPPGSHLAVSGQFLVAAVSSTTLTRVRRDPDHRGTTTRKWTNRYRENLGKPFQSGLINAFIEVRVLPAGGPPGPARRVTPGGRGERSTKEWTHAPHPDHWNQPVGPPGAPARTGTMMVDFATAIGPVRGGATRLLYGLSDEVVHTDCVPRRRNSADDHAEGPGAPLARPAPHLAGERRPMQSGYCRDSENPIT